VVLDEIPEINECDIPSLSEFMNFVSLFNENSDKDGHTFF
jgi:hypothetical protein